MGLTSLVNNYHRLLYYKKNIFRFEDCWSALRKDVQGLIFVYNKKTDDQIQELEKFYNYFVLKSQLEPKDCVVFFFESDKQVADAPKRLCMY